MKQAQAVFELLQERYAGEKEYLQAVKEVFESLGPLLEQRPHFKTENLLLRIAEPDRVISFKVCWQNDAGEWEVNRGYRIQANNALGPYKGGLRFHPNVTPSVLKFLAFEQTFKNALTGLPLGGAKGGADFNPKGRSEAEIRRFCQAWMLEAYKYLGHFRDIPAGDIGVGEREIGFLFGTYKKLSDSFEGMLTGKGVTWGGSQLRSEATGYGLVYFATYMLEDAGYSLKNKRCIVTGAGKVSIYAAEKLLQEEAKVIALSDSSGWIHYPDGITEEDLDQLKEVKLVKGESLNALVDKERNILFHKEPETLWELQAQCVFPCATQNEIDRKIAQQLAKQGILLIAEGANMPLTSEAQEVILKSKVLYAPGKASNAGGGGCFRVRNEPKPSRCILV
ncbi:glutamate dehydrogenase [Nitritalea halalkaliphila LW7]|uniref:Glutamate dehydrogenase n=1 Tax=Nitritalea halalkaliphila LW7 TaxID=1189621 RepID=I5CAI4_9BACT|nr:NADP-specific glutamate dehydrogenase [Nitritalea halalkaliphila]EIM78836.1 glutamate dehydrogenase [Nitritalea halalkaliphila LW7]